MTAPDIAAALLRDVKRYTFDTNGELLYEREVLAALTAALDGVDERATLTVLRLRSGLDNADRGADGERELGGVVLTMNDAADLITALLAQNAALRAEAFEWRDKALENFNRATKASQDAEAAEAQIAALTAQVERLTRLLREAQLMVSSATYAGAVWHHNTSAALSTTEEGHDPQA